MKNRQIIWWKILAITLIGGFVWIIMAKTIPTFTPHKIIAYGKNYLMEKEAAGPFLIGYVFAVLGFFCLVFIIIQGKLQGSKLAKGFFFGLLFALLWSIEFLDYHHIFGNATGDGIPSALRDGIPLLLTGVLCGLFLGSDSSKTQDTIKFDATIKAMVLFAIHFSIGRAVYYAFVLPNAKEMGWEGLSIVLMLGAWIGVMYVALDQGSLNRSALGKAVFFGMFVFGINWSLMLINPIINYTIPLYIIILYIAFDLFMVTLSAYAFEVAKSISLRKQTARIFG
ncbi:MAG: hypothetical protein GY874_11370 [Desulfobacteraceae bacterium]|nr:hypothetical protein [Desulfobacteraceae bacterium]